jgi:hypothetical protein
MYVNVGPYEDDLFRDTAPILKLITVYQELQDCVGVDVHVRSLGCCGLFDFIILNFWETSTS